MTIPEIVTLDDLRAHLGIPAIPTPGSPSPGSPEDDRDLQLKIDAATQLVCEYISDRHPADPDWISTIESWSTGSPSAPPNVRLAVLEQAGDFYRYRGDDAADDRPRVMDTLTPAVANLLTRYHNQSFA